MKEKEIRAKALDILEKKDFVCWYPYRNRWGSEQDIFGVFDCCCFHKDKQELLFIQLTTKSHISERVKKVISFIIKLRWRCDLIKFQVWGYIKGKNNFVIKEL